jgi:hypothetical protein
MLTETRILVGSAVGVTWNTDGYVSYRDARDERGK